LLLHTLDDTRFPTLVAGLAIVVITMSRKVWWLNRKPTGRAVVLTDESERDPT